MCKLHHASFSPILLLEFSGFDLLIIELFFMYSERVQLTKYKYAKKNSQMNIKYLLILFLRSNKLFIYNS